MVGLRFESFERGGYSCYHLHFHRVVTTHSPLFGIALQGVSSRKARGWDFKLTSNRNDFTTKRLPIELFRYPGLLSMVGLILGITGGVKASDSSNPFVLNPETKAAVIIFVVVYLVSLVILVLLFLRISQVKAGERRLLVVVAVCSPFIATRLVYAIISDFADNHLFNSTYGNLTIYLCMAVIEEIIVVALCVAVGFTLEVVPKATTTEEVPLEPTSNNAINADKVARPATQQRPRQNRRRGGPITWLFRTVRDYIRSKKGQEA